MTKKNKTGKGAQKVDIQHLRMMLKYVSEGVFTVDRDKRITFFNEAAEKITGFAPEEALGRRCSDVFRSDMCAQGCVLDEVTERKESVTDRRAGIVDKYGRSLTVSVNAGPLYDASGSVAGCIETFRDVSSEEELRRLLEKSYSFEDIVSRHSKMDEIFAVLPDIAAADVPVLVEGESGTGKELLARAIHSLSPRSDGRFVAVSCGSIPDSLLESELFGYKKGAFTDAREDKPGRFDIANGGSLLLDEIADISSAMQVRLLRVLQEKTYEPLGGTEPARSDARIIAATNRHLRDEVKAGRFREDLYYRLNVVRLELPALSERRCDVPLLVEHFRRRLNAETGKNIEGVAPEVMDILMKYDFPGNIRELENVMRHAFVLCRGDVIEEGHLSEDLRVSGGDAGGASSRTLQDIEMEAIRSALSRHGGNRSSVSRELGIDPSTLYRKMKRYGIK
ncbi:MAG: sigma 54-interacting transcriptional regulator [Kiritimatiellia bacterium]